MTIISTETDVSNYWTSSVAETTVAATTAFTPSWTATGDTNGGLALVTFKESSGASPTLDQFGFRWRLDDGSETTATWAAAQNAAP